MKTINILVTLDSNYIKPLKVMLTSLFLNNTKDQFTIYLMHSSLSEDEVDELEVFSQEAGHLLTEIYIENNHFEEAPAHMHYTKEMYYRLLAFKFLPNDLERILYLDPDILVINPIADLYHLDFEGHLFAAASHDTFSVKEINKIRFYPIEIKDYFNSGVLLMNLTLIREEINDADIFQFVEDYQDRLILPDQDVLNALYSKRIKSIDERLYNYDARYFTVYKLKSKNKWDMDYIMNHTVILHFCGKKKPWNKGYSGDFHALYKHYENLVKIIE